MDKKILKMDLKKKNYAPKKRLLQLMPTVF